MSTKRTIKFDVITISDRCFRKETTDQSGTLLLKLGIDHFENLNLNVESTLHLLPDDLDQIKQLLVYLCDEKSVNLILTTGGTGLSPTDVTPEATSQISEKLVPGISTMILMGSIKHSKNAYLSRGVCAIRKNTLIINLPGSIRAVKECFEAVSDCLVHSVDLISNNLSEVNQHHHSLATTHLTNENSFMKERNSSYEMISLQDAKNIIESEALLQRCSITIPTSLALNYVLVEDIHATFDIPPCDCSLKDGYAVQAPLSKDAILSIIDHSEIESYEFQPHNCYRISTGFYLPQQTNCVIPVENTLLYEMNSTGCESNIQIIKSCKPGEEIRNQGSDIKQTQLLIKKSTLLTSEHLALLASARVTDVTCYKIPIIGVVSTGDELVDISTNVDNCDITVFDSNRLFLINKLKQLGYNNIIDGGIEKDNYNSITNKIKFLSELCDIIITSGSASMGDKDYIKKILVNEFNANIFFGRINLKPGKPTSFATFSTSDNRKILFFSLPGNPVSCSVMFNVLVRDALSSICCRPTLSTIQLTLSVPVTLTDQRPECFRCVYDTKNNTATPLCDEQQSSRVISICGANLLVVLPGRTDSLNSVSESATLSAFVIDYL